MTLYKFLKYLLVFGVVFVLYRYTFFIILIWGFLEVVIFAIRHKNIVKIREFICNFVLTVLNCIDILSNIILAVPANRILITTTEKHHFGNPKDSFTKILRLNFVYGTLKPRGVTLYNIIRFFKKILH